jgi:hypothetical protein
MIANVSLRLLYLIFNRLLGWQARNLLMARRPNTATRSSVSSTWIGSNPAGNSVISSTSPVPESCSIVNRVLIHRPATSMSAVQDIDYL